MKPCPFCAEDIQDAAIVCRFCNRDLASASPSQPAMPEAPIQAISTPRPHAHKRSDRIALIVLGIGVVIAVLGIIIGGGRQRSTYVPPSDTQAPRPQIFVRRGTEGMTLTNDSDTAHWRRCEVEIEGGYRADGFGDLPPRGKVTIYFPSFRTSGGQRLADGDGYSRSLSDLRLNCQADDDRRYTITVR